MIQGLARCYTNEDAARATCPLDKDVLEKKFKEIMLFRKHFVSIFIRNSVFSTRFALNLRSEHKLLGVTKKTTKIED